MEKCSRGNHSRMPRYCPSEGLREPKAPFVAHTVEDRARWQCESKQRTVERTDDEHQSFPQHRQPTAPPGAGAQTSLVERVQEPPEADLINSILEPDYRVASTEPSPVETLQLSLSLARISDQRRAPNPCGCPSGEGVLPPTPNITRQLSAHPLQAKGRGSYCLGRSCFGDRPVTFLNVRLN